jgi:hypothetical protein
MEQAPGALTNLAARNAGKVRELLTLLEEQIESGRSTSGPSLQNERQD